jgi:hypothetical protein
LDSIRAFASDGTLKLNYDSPDIPFAAPHGVLTDIAEKVLIVADADNHRLLMFDIDTGVHIQTHQEGLSFIPRFMARQPNGQILVGNFARGAVEVFVLR